MRKLCSTILVSGVAIFFGCGGGSGGGGGYSNNPNDPGGGGDTCPAGTVCMRAASFNPTSLTVANNTTVTFSNNSNVDHNVVFDPPLPAATANIGLISYGSVATRTFGTVGTYTFHCTIHNGMIGQVVVQ
jgi:plastocyanin